MKKLTKEQAKEIRRMFNDVVAGSSPLGNADFRKFIESNTEDKSCSNCGLNNNGYCDKAGSCDDDYSEWKPVEPEPFEVKEEEPLIDPTVKESMDKLFPQQAKPKLPEKIEKRYREIEYDTKIAWDKINEIIDYLKAVEK